MVCGFMIIHSWITTWPFFGYYMCLFAKEKKKKMLNIISLKINPQNSYFEKKERKKERKKRAENRSVASLVRTEDKWKKVDCFVKKQKRARK